MPIQFDHEKLHVYQIALQFVAWSTPLLREVKERSSAESANTRDHLDRASLSTVYNIAEGNGKYALGSRQNFWDIARGSAVECAACLDTLVAKGLMSAERVNEGKGLLLRIVQMLTKMVFHAKLIAFEKMNPGIVLNMKMIQGLMCRSSRVRARV